MTASDLPTPDSVRRRAMRLLTRPSAPPAPPAAEAGLRAAPPGPRFSPFDPAHAMRAVQLAHLLIRRTTPSGNVAIGSEVQRVDRALAELEGERDAELAKYALSLFAVNTELGRRYVRKPLVWHMFPEKFRPTEQARQGGLLRAAQALTPAQKEAMLAWFREDPLLNEHHYHWHVVYPQGGDPAKCLNPNEPDPNKWVFAPKDRQGELFFYMHRQMLARYDAERTCLGIGLVEPYVDFTTPVAVGYDAHLDNFVPRPDEHLPGKSFVSSRSGEATPQTLKQWEATLMESIALKRWKETDDAEITPTRLGGALEADADAPGFPNPEMRFPQAGPYGNLHNMGHMLLAVAVPDPLDQNRLGVMADTATAVRDSIFWRWHRHVDDVFEAWQGSLDPARFDDAPDVAIPKDQGIVLVFRDQIPGSSDPAFDYRAWGEANLPPSGGAPATDELQTMMLHRTIETVEWLPDNKSRPITFDVDYLDQREFVSFFRVFNPKPAKQTVTLRVFLALDEHVDDRRMWIEMDRFGAELQPGENLVARPAWLSSVVRKPCAKPPIDYDPSHLADGDGPQLDPDSGEAYCDCGWPYNLLLPRGTPEGAKARLFVMATDFSKDVVPGAEIQEEDDCCGSLSFCGSKSPIYPDTREMGYPFHRRFQPGGFEATFDGLPNAAWRPVTIRWTNPR